MHSHILLINYKLYCFSDAQEGSVCTKSTNLFIIIYRKKNKILFAIIETVDIRTAE